MAIKLISYYFSCKNFQELLYVQINDRKVQLYLLYSLIINTIYYKHLLQFFFSVQVRPEFTNLTV